MVLKVSKRGAVPPFLVMDVLRAANEREAAGEDVLHLEVGQPGTGAPAAVVAATQAVLASDPLGYTEALGLPRLRTRIAAHYGEAYGLDVAPERIVITTGASGGFLLAFLSAFEAGDRVGIVEPGYPAYRNILNALGLQPIAIRASMENRFQPSVEQLVSLASDLDGLILASPSNPTGTMLSRDAFEHLAAFCSQSGIRLISDEIYHGITYGEPAASALEFDRQAIVVNSFSKYYSMTGWRVGWMVVPEPLLRSIECLAQNLFISPPTLSQHGAIAVFDCQEELDATVAAYAKNRELLLEELPKAGFDKLAPADGAFYLYADISSFSSDSENFCRAMLEETGVAATPGIDFDPVEGNRTVRFSFAGSTATMAEAARRLKNWRP
ncbi:aminotransferase class I/II-fold pyridoxal phosphate-dependent enzyme [Rhodospirillaceae bacterium AH-315-P19]|nr:aminotransferase class I/II-fold pyridoxal phosphate-dependent enzyme [Rhodospirillaceae bacterium AH-315-P19]